MAQTGWVSRDETRPGPDSMVAAGRHGSGMVVLGIDLAADPAQTGVATLRVETARVVVMVHPETGSDHLLVALAKGADLVGVDAPLGWPGSLRRPKGARARRRPCPTSVPGAHLPLPGSGAERAGEARLA
jgi:hypothetical protein